MLTKRVVVSEGSGEVAIVIEEAVLDSAEVIAYLRPGVVDRTEIGVLAVGVADRVDGSAVGIADKALERGVIDAGGVAIADRGCSGVGAVGAVYRYYFAGPGP